METHDCSSIEITLLTPPGRGALAVVGVAGPGAIDLVARAFTPRGRQPLADRPDGAIIFGRWGDLERGEELVVVRHAADQLEVHCHGGLAASDAVIASLTSSSPSGQPAAVGHNAPLPAIEAEAREALTRAGSPKAARILCRQLAGALGAELERIGSLRQAGDFTAADAATERLMLASRVGLRLVEPWRVVVSGPVNVGKSSVVNALAGYSRSIVSAEPGTTRDVVVTRLVLGGWEIDLIDTAGLREPEAATSATERAGIERAIAAAANADLEVCFTEMRPSMARISSPAIRPEETRASSPRPAGLNPSMARISLPAIRPEETRASSPPSTGLNPSMARISLPAIRPDAALPRCITVFSKCDLAPDVAAPPGAILTSALTGKGIQALAAAIVAALVPEEAANPELLAGPVPFTARQIATVIRDSSRRLAPGG
jgi:tRNA modification GTPase